MLTEIKSVIVAKVLEIGFNFEPSKIWTKEMIKIAYDNSESNSFPTWKCVYYAKGQSSGTCGFYLRFSRHNAYLDYIDLSANISVYLMD